MSANPEVKTSGSGNAMFDLDSVGLAVERLPAALKDAGVNEQDLFTFVRERLRKATVQVLSRTGALHLLGAPTLFLEVSLFEKEPGSYAYVVTLELTQGIQLERQDSESFFTAGTWRAQAVGFVQKSELPQVKDAIGAAADAFVKDFSGARPPSASPL